MHGFGTICKVWETQFARFGRLNLHGFARFHTFCIVRMVSSRHYFFGTICMVSHVLHRSHGFFSALFLSLCFSFYAASHSTWSFISSSMQKGPLFLLLCSLQIHLPSQGILCFQFSVGKLSMLLAAASRV